MLNLPLGRPGQKLSVLCLGAHSDDVYGNYRGTLGIFSGCQQPDLTAAYSSGHHSVKPLNFGFGYLVNPQTTSIMVGRPSR